MKKDKHINNSNYEGKRLRSRYPKNTFEILMDNEHLGSIIFLVILIPFYFYYINRHFESSVVSNIIVTGLVQGAYYALIAVGFAIIFGIAKMFKLSIGGYFVVGAYIAFWLNSVVYLPINDIAAASIDSSTMLIFKFLIYIPVVLFFSSFIYYIKWDRLLGISISIGNIILFFVQRRLLVNNYFKFNQEASVLAIIIQMSILFVGMALIYLELSKKQVVLSMLILNVVVVIINTSKRYPESPGIYIAIFLLSVLFTAGLAMLVDRYLLENTRSNQTNVLIITFGIALLIQSFIPIFKFPANGEFIEFGIDTRNLEGILPKYEGVILLGQPVQTIRVVASVIAIFLLLIVYVFINHTPMGHAMKAVSEDPEAAWLVGINVRKVYLISAGLGMGLSAAAGVLTSPFSASPSWGVYMGWSPLIFAIAVVTLGGIGSIFGGVIAGFILGFTEAAIASENVELSKIVPLFVILIIIIVRPNGLFGVPEENE